MSQREVLAGAHTPDGIIDDTLHEVLYLNEKGKLGAVQSYTGLIVESYSEDGGHHFSQDRIQRMLIVVCGS